MTGQGRLLASPPDLPGVVGVLEAFVMPPTSALVAGEPFPSRWPAGGPWKAGTGGKTG